MPTTNRALTAIAKRVLALPPQDGFDAFVRAIPLLPILDEPALSRRFKTPADLHRAVKAGRLFGDRLAAIVVDFAIDPDATTERFDALLAEERRPGRLGPDFALDMPATFVRKLRPFVGLFRKGDTLLGDLTRQRDLPAQPAPAALLGLEERVFALAPEAVHEAVRRALASLDELYRAALRPPRACSPYRP